MPRYGIIDIGSNTVRLCVYHLPDDRRTTYTKHDFHSIVNNRVMAGLSAYVVKGIFTEEGIAHAVEVLQGHIKRLKYYRCKQTSVFATAVLRNCSNSAEAIRAIEQNTGLSITLLSAEEEAHLGFVGATSDRPIAEGTLIDIGGSSTEITRIRGGLDRDKASIRQGSLSSYVICVQAILPTENEIANIANTFDEYLASLENTDRYHSEQVFGIGGSVRAASKLYLKISGETRRRDTLSMSMLDTMIDLCIDDPNRFARFALMAAADRVHTVIPGCIIARRILEHCGASSLLIAKKGVREGYLIERMLKTQTPHGFCR